MRWLLPLFLLLLLGCGPRSPQDCRSRGENLMRKLIKEMEQIQTREELIAHSPRLRLLFEQVADLMLKAEKNLNSQQLGWESLGWEPSTTNQALNERLRQELIRVYEIPGGRELIEQAQEPALNKFLLR